MILRGYQIDILNKMQNAATGNYIFPVATGLGKTVCFTSYINSIACNEKKVLILNNKIELVTQPLKYIKDNLKVGIEQDKHKATTSDIIVSASIPTLVKRLHKYDRNHFYAIIWDECHHIASMSYSQIFNYFNPQFNFGFTATPNRHDKKTLSLYFDNILAEYNLIWGIQNRYLTDIRCKRFYIEMDLTKIRQYKKDFNIEELEKSINTNTNNKAISRIYNKYSEGQTLIFATSIDHANDIAKEIKNSKVVHSKISLEERNQILDDFKAEKFRCLINVMILTEGVDIPNLKTIIIARPTKNLSLYTQMVGRMTRLHPNKKYALLIDLVGVSNLNVCTAASLLGITIPDQENKANTMDKIIEGDLFDLPIKINKSFDKPEFWKINYKNVNIWAKGLGYNLHDINFYKLPNGFLSLNIPSYKVALPPPDLLGMVDGKPYQKLIDEVYKELLTNHSGSRALWDMNIMKHWKFYPATDKQKQAIKYYFPKMDVFKLTKLEAAQIMSRINYRR